ncbi:alpha/beta hydrolase [Microbulbifer sp. JMSA004]|uniref:lipase family protein n=1 Tax=unclassified Microbulbifer TaxID=2619833 RepID=UPI0024AD84DD|nr:lipase family protein [Microbulbifer sp. VAAF005]WHI44520.1 lipase family protein [Microbulbifer sp. VAAF005]
MLSPKYTAKLAADTYLVKESRTRKLFYELYKNDFDIDEKITNKIDAEAGAFIFLKSTDARGIATLGKGQHKGQAFFSILGTDSLYDLLTDLNTGVRRFHTGGAVHQGFYYTFESLLPQLERFVQNLPSDIHTINCLGHSLGGAIATLAADWLSSNTEKSIKLYTFGSPRVGLDHFASGCKRKLKSENIYRVYHRADPVPMVPTWPFIHVPNGGTGDFELPTPSHNPGTNHSSKTYVKSVSPNGTSLDWDTVRLRKPKGNIEKSVEAWLRSDGVLSLTLNTAWIAGEALLWVLKKIAHLAGISLVVAGGTTFTLLDRLAIFLHKAYEISKDISFWVLRLIRRLAQLIGIAVVEGADITVSFIRMIFLRMHHMVSELVMRAGRGNQ